MNNALRKLAFFIGIGLLFVSMYWSQDGFNFDVAGDSGYKNVAIGIGWFLAITVTVVEFVFSSNYKELNPSLILFGILAYAYSIYTNIQGILHFQGAQTSMTGAIVLGIVMDGIPEPLIAWGLYESLTGDFIGNLLKTIFSAPNKLQEKNISKHQVFNKDSEKTEKIHDISPELLKKLGKSDHNLHRAKNSKPSRFEL